MNEETHGVYIEKEDQEDELIGSVYYDPRFGYRGIDTIYHKLKDKGITRKKIKDFLNKQEIIQINKKPDFTSSFIPMYENQEFQIDLIYLENKHLNQASYGLCCIDVFSKKADVELMKRKDEHSVLEAFKNILKRMNKPYSIYCDEGTEFTNKEFKKYCDENDIELIITLRHAPVVERFNRTIKEMLYKFLKVSKSKTITNVLPILIENYNDSYHKTIKMAPNEVNSSNENQVYENIYKASKVSSREPLKVGDKVRVLIKEKTGDKKYHGRWSSNLHTIIKKDKHYYYVDDNNKAYLRAYLLKVNDSETQEVKPMLENTQEGRLKDMAKEKALLPKSKTENEPFESVAINRPRRVIKKPDYYTIAK